MLPLCRFAIHLQVARPSKILTVAAFCMGTKVWRIEQAHHLLK